MTSRSSVRRETSAGGVVFRRDGDRTLVLLIRDGHRNWGFPKGHLERGEAPEEAALREVREETGLRELEVVAPVDTIAWTFRFRGKRIHKTCHFFAVATPEARTTPQRREGITACRWCSLEEALTDLSYDNARGVLRRAGEMARTLIAVGAGRPRSIPKPIQSA